jgi:hypothetical protein
MKDPRVPGQAAYRALSGRQRVLIALLAVAAAFTVVTTLLDPPGGVKRQHLERADAPRCAASQADDCVGGKVDVIVPPAPVGEAGMPAR